MALRIFGSDLGDLAVEFEALERPHLVTSLLARCSQTREGGSPPEQAIWELPLGTRIEAVAILAGGEAGRPLEWHVRCARCGAESELQLTPAELASLAQAAYREKLVPVKAGSRTAWLRRPTGDDQRRWLEGGTEGTASIGASLFVEPAFEDLGIGIEDLGETIDQAMQEFDPLVGFVLEVGCPECGYATPQMPDLLAAAIERLWMAQYDLIEQVHRLASHYHWSEEEISRLPAWRRHAYLACIADGEL